MEKEEWEAWLEIPVTRRVIALLQEKHDEYLSAKQSLNPAAVADAQKFFAASLVLAAKAESYLAIVESFNVDAFESIFEE